MHQLQFEIPKAALLWLSNSIGKSLYCIGFEKGICKLKGSIVEVDSAIQLEAEGAENALRIAFQIEGDADIAYIPLKANVVNIQNKMASEWQFSAFQIRKVELWAEKTGPDNNKLLSINTLLFSSFDDTQLLIYPWGPKPWITITENKSEIDRILNSGNLYLKHIID